MVDEPECLMFAILRQIQEDLASVRRTVEAHDRRFDSLERRFDEMHETAITALGLAGNSNIQLGNMQKYTDELFDKVKQFEGWKAQAATMAEVIELKARVARLEEKV